MNVPNATQRLKFREANEADAAFFLKLMNEPDYHRYIGNRQISDLTKAANYVREKLIQSYRSNGFGLWLVTRLSDGEPLGICGIVERDGFDGPDLGYAFLAEHGGSGFAREAAHAVQKHAERELELTQLLAIVTPDNSRSVKLLQKLGFTRSDEMAFPGTDDLVDIYCWKAALD